MRVSNVDVILRRCGIQIEEDGGCGLEKFNNFSLFLVRVALGERDRLVGLMKVSTRNNAHWERPFASTISSTKSMQCLEIQLRAEKTCGGGRREKGGT